MHIRNKIVEQNQSRWEQPRLTFVIFKIEENWKFIILSLWTMANNYQNIIILLSHFLDRLYFNQKVYNNQYSYKEMFAMR